MIKINMKAEDRKHAVYHYLNNIFRKEGGHRDREQNSVVTHLNVLGKDMPIVIRSDACFIANNWHVQIPTKYAATGEPYIDGIRSDVNHMDIYFTPSLTKQMKIDIGDGNPIFKEIEDHPSKDIYPHVNLVNAVVDSIITTGRIMEGSYHTTMNLSFLKGILNGSVIPISDDRAYRFFYGNEEYVLNVYSQSDSDDTIYFVQFSIEDPHAGCSVGSASCSIIRANETVYTWQFKSICNEWDYRIIISEDHPDKAYTFTGKFFEIFADIVNRCHWFTFSLGYWSPAIVYNPEFVDKFEDDEVRYYIGHKLNTNNELIGFGSIGYPTLYTFHRFCYGICDDYNNPIKRQQVFTEHYYPLSILHEFSRIYISYDGAPFNFSFEAHDFVYIGNDRNILVEMSIKNHTHYVSISRNEFPDTRLKLKFEDGYRGVDVKFMEKMDVIWHMTFDEYTNSHSIYNETHLIGTDWIYCTCKEIFKCFMRPNDYNAELINQFPTRDEMIEVLQYFKKSFMKEQKYWSGVIEDVYGINRKFEVYYDGYHYIRIVTDNEDVMIGLPNLYMFEKPHVGDRKLMAFGRNMIAYGSRINSFMSTTAYSLIRYIQKYMDAYLKQYPVTLRYNEMYQHARMCVSSVYGVVNEWKKNNGEIMNIFNYLYFTLDRNVDDKKKIEASVYYDHDDKRIKVCERTDNINVTYTFDAGEEKEVYGPGIQMLGEFFETWESTENKRDINISIAPPNEHDDTFKIFLCTKYYIPAEELPLIKSDIEKFPDITKGDVKTKKYTCIEKSLIGAIRHRYSAFASVVEGENRIYFHPTPDLKLDDAISDLIVVDFVDNKIMIGANNAAYTKVEVHPIASPSDVSVIRINGDDTGSSANHRWITTVCGAWKDPDGVIVTPFLYV